MRLRTLIAIVVMVVMAGAAIAAAAFGAAPFSGLIPAGSGCSVTVHSENAGDDAIQTAINAYPGGTICIGSGTFPEQLTIAASGTTLKGAGDTKTILEPTSGSGLGSLTFNTVDWDSAPYTGGVTCGTSTCVPLAAIILVGSSTPPASTTPTTGVTVEDLEVNGAGGSSNIACGDDYVGVDFQDAQGTLSSSAVVNVASPPAALGCQEVSGAVYAYNGYYYDVATSTTPASAPVSVTISGSVVTGYQKNGITCDDPEETCAVSSTSVTGAGPIDNNAQNGIQVAYGAYGQLSHDTISGNNYTDGLGGSTNDWYANGYAATGILLFDSATGTTVSYNTLASNQIGIAYGDDGTFDSGSAATIISHNSVKTSVAYGIVANGAPGGNDQVTILSNTVDNEYSLDHYAQGAPDILVDTGVFAISDNILEGSNESAGASNGAGQTVCGPDATSGGSAVTGTPYLYCTAYGNLTTAAIQGASESGTSQTNVTLSGNQFVEDNNELDTLGVLGGSVNVDWV